MSPSRMFEAASPRAVWLAGSILMAIALVFRLYLLRTSFASVDGDQAVVGIMAYHIQAGDRPIFYYGQPYTGSLEAYLAAPLFGFFGANDLTLRLPALLCSVLFVGLVYYLGALLYGLRIAILTGAVLAIGTGFLVTWSTAAGANYVEVMVCGAALLILAARYPDPYNIPPRIALAAGLLAGVGVWLQPMIGEYLLALALVYGARLVAGWRRREATGGSLTRTIALLLIGGVIGTWPLLLFNLQHQGQTFAFMLRTAHGGDHAAVAVRVVTQSVPILLGLAIPTNEYQGPTDFAPLAALHPLAYLAGLVIGGYLLGRLVLDPRGLPGRIAALRHPPARQEPICWARPDGCADGALALFGVICMLFFVLTGFGATYTATSRPCYLLPLYTITPLVLDTLIPRQPTRREVVIAVAALALLVLGGLAITQSTPQREAIGGLAHLLEQRGIRVAYANDYWIDYRLAFATHERVLVIGVRDDLRYGLTRLPAYIGEAARTQARQIAWIFYNGRPAGEAAFRRYLRRHHLHACRVTWGDRVIYACLAQPVRAAGHYFLHGNG